jgi:hypothetical protein
MFTESLTPGPELENSQGHDLPFAAQKNCVCFRAKLPFLKGLESG